MECKTAYQTLVNESQRRQYDRTLQVQLAPCKSITDICKLQIPSKSEIYPYMIDRLSSDEAAW